MVDISKLRTRTYSALRRLGEYELLRKIGSGGMAEVWMGRRAALAGASKAVAIKLLAPNLLDDPTYRQMFVEEARLSMLLTNSNVVQVFDVGEINGECFMVMEWVDGLNLSELARKMQKGDDLPVVVAAHVIGEVLRGLAYAHGLHHEGSKATIVHRDVSPHNVIVSVSGEVKLADFGVARLAREETSGLHVKGKLRYMAPEQLRGRSRDPTVDLYAVGAILHELLAGERFRQTRDEADLYSMVLSGEYAPLATEVPAELARLCERLLEPDPSHRIQSADEALELLYAWSGYRNSALALGKLIRKWVGVGGPRSGIVSSDTLLGGGQPQGPKNGSGPSTASAASTIPADAKAAAPALSPPIESGPSEAVTAVEPVERDGSGSSEERGAPETRTWLSSAERETEATSVIGSEPQARGPASSMLIAVAVTLALSFGVFGVGFPLGWWSGGGDEGVSEPVKAASAEAADEPIDDDPVVAVVDPPVVEVDKAEVRVPHETETETETETGAGDETGADDETETDAETGSGESGGSQGAIKPKVKVKPVDRTPAEVDFNVGNFGFVWVKVGSKQLLLEPRGRLSLPPGLHRVQFRVTEDGDWQTAKKIKVKAGKHYKVRMVKPSGLTIEEI